MLTPLLQVLGNYAKPWVAWWCARNQSPSLHLACQRRASFQAPVQLAHKGCQNACMATFRLLFVERPPPPYAALPAPCDAMCLFGQQQSLGQVRNDSLQSWHAFNETKRLLGMNCNDT